MANQNEPHAPSGKEPHDGQLEAEAKLLAAFLAYLAYMTSTTRTVEFMMLVDTGQYDAAMAVIDAAVSETLAPAVTAVAIKAGSEEVPSFDPTKSPVLAVERQSFIQRFVEDAKLAMLIGISAYVAVRSTRRLIVNFGLTTAQEQAVTAYRNALETGSKRAIDTIFRDRRGDAAIQSGRPLTAEQIDRMVATYRRRMLQARGKTLANIEGGRAWNVGRAEAIAQVAALYEGVWNTVGDDRVRASHVAMDGQVQPFGGVYISGLGNMLKYPHDPIAPIADTINCRCWIEYRRRRLVNDR